MLPWKRSIFSVALTGSSVLLALGILNATYVVPVLLEGVYFGTELWREKLMGDGEHTRALITNYPGCFTQFDFLPSCSQVDTATNSLANSNLNQLLPVMTP